LGIGFPYKREVLDLMVVKFFASIRIQQYVCHLILLGF